MRVILVASLMLLGGIFLSITVNELGVLGNTLLQTFGYGLCLAAVFIASKGDRVIHRIGLKDKKVVLGLTFTILLLVLAGILTFYNSLYGRVLSIGAIIALFLSLNRAAVITNSE